jgi:hypothetical protein
MSTMLSRAVRDQLQWTMTAVKSTAATTSPVSTSLNPTRRRAGASGDGVSAACIALSLALSGSSR